MIGDEEPKKETAHVVGCDLSTLSIEELEKRLVLLAEETARLESAIASKRASMATAENFFKS